MADHPYVPPNRTCTRCRLIDYKRRPAATQGSLKGQTIRLCEAHWRELLQLVERFTRALDVHPL